MHRSRRLADSRCAADSCDGYGLLVPAATVSSRRLAADVRGLLADYAIRSTVVPATGAATRSTGRAGQRWNVVVFPEDGAAAYRVLSTTLPEP